MAGLLDAIFNPSAYSGQGGGLLDMLRTAQMQQDQYQPSAGFPGQASPIGVGGYQMPRIGDQAQFTPPPPDPAALPVNAQPAQGQLPQQPQQPSGFGGFLQNLNENFQSMGQGGSLIGAFTGQSPTNQTAQYLIKQGIDPVAAKAIVSDPATLRAVLPNILGFGGKTDDIKEFEYARKEDPTLTFAKFMLQKKANQGEYSLTPQYGTNDKGETVLIQTGKSGEAIQTKLPAGVKISSGVDKVDLGTQWGIIDKRTGQMVGTQPKDVAGKEAAEKRGQAQGVAQAALANGADIDARETLKKIDQFVNSEGFNQIFGQIDQYRPNWTLSDAGTDSLARYEQLTGTAFLSAYSMLKGGGAITDIEGQKAGAAMARLSRAQSEAAAKQALQDFKEAVEIGLEKLKRAAARGNSPVPGPATPAATGLPAGWTVKVN